MSTAKRLHNEVAWKIRAMIDSGQFPPGSRLPAERDLAKSLGVSRVTTREAQIALPAQKLIEVRTGSGAKVLPPKADRTTARHQCVRTHAGAHGV
ncbi:FadR/GntR family transcriptional regulator [Maricaulis sp.]|uniref:FadR/GntR family transcriptional regulator n=1 Tax=Maricaulis sp. TaxID=1486257 RepID=UPI002B277787|nr:GntR family transcriptional regulator [Maricaulis sp.]